VALFLYNGSAPVNDDIVLAQGGMISLQKSATNQWIAVGVGASQP
jgi:membrane protein DedA with SNARE-associated domain